jgi:membrane protease YdiL (CAAX protease family)
MLPQNTGRLLLVSLGELFFFGLVFGLAWLLSRVTPGQLRLTWRGTIAPVVRGFAYSIALRIVVAIGVVLAFAILHVVVGTPEGGVKASMPRVDAIVDPAALSKDPVYLILMLTLVSFVVAGLREELWRAGMLAGFETLFPNMFQSRTGAMLAVTLIAVAFGLGHLIQGWIAVGVATLLGIGLGAIILIHRSIWDAVLAHGFFDATTFALLCLVGRFAPDLFPGK